MWKFAFMNTIWKLFLSLLFFQVWVFTDPAGVIGIMAEITGGTQIFPEDGKDWTIEEVPNSGIYKELGRVELCCQETGAPTRMPTDSKLFLFFYTTTYECWDWSFFFEIYLVRTGLKNQNHDFCEAIIIILTT